MIPLGMLGAATPRGSVVGPWTPVQLSPELYLDSRVEAGGLTLKSGDARVLSWADLGSSGAVFTSPDASTGVGPKPRTINGLRAVFFDAADNPDQLEGDAVARALINSGDEFTLLVVGRTAAPGAYSHPLVYWSTQNGGATVNRTRLRLTHTTSGQLSLSIRDTDAGGGGAVSSITTFNNAPFIALCPMDRAGDDYRLRVNGAEEDQESPGFTASSRSTAQVARLGRWGNSTSTDWATVDLLAVVLCKGNLSLSDWQKLEGWAAWAFQGDASDADFVALLPVGHPYKAAPPST